MAGKVDEQLFESINFNEVLSHWEKVGATEDVELCREDINFQDYACRAMGLEAENIKELESICSVSGLAFEGEVDDGHCLLNQVPPAVNLATVQNRKGEQEKMKDGVYKMEFRKKLKYRFLNQPAIHSILNAVQMDEGGPKKPADSPEVLINVRIYVPQYRGVGHVLRVSQEFQVLGHQTLAELRDVIECEADNMGALERSSQADLVVNLKAKDIYKSGFFFIGTTFYNDFRSANSKDCSETVIRWMSENGSTVEYKKADMATTRFNELSVRMGYPYLYCHQGNCEHLLSFTDVTLMNPATVCDISKYPVLIGRHNFRSQKCRACVSSLAVWLVRNSEHTPEDPCLMCETCFRMLHYDAQGKKMGNFVAYAFNLHHKHSK